MKKRVIRFSFIVFICVMFIFILFFARSKMSSCGDDSFEEKCSIIQPYFCSEGVLIEKASVCGCPENLVVSEDSCVSEYKKEPKELKLNYVLRGEKGEINFIVYGELADYLLNISKSAYSFNGEYLSRKDFKLNHINEEEQRKLLLPLVVEIQNLVKDKTDQVRIAISLVQMIPYVESDKEIFFAFSKINSSRYAYEVLYDDAGACEGKSELLLFLLRELGYGTALIYYPLEDHESVGISCPVEDSFDETGYCFVETTGASILSNSEEYYVGWGRLSSDYQIIQISEGISLGSNLYEYSDAKTFAKLDKIVEETGKLNIFRHYKYQSLKEKYGLDSSIIL